MKEVLRKLKEKKENSENEQGSIELIVIGLLAALIIVLAIPLLKDTGSKTQSALTSLNTQMS